MSAIREARQREGDLSAQSGKTSDCLAAARLICQRPTVVVVVAGTTFRIWRSHVT